MSESQLKDYDDNYLVDEIAKGELTYAQIAEQTGLSKDHVGRIARGQLRAELYDRILTARRSYIDRARDLCVRLALPAMQRLGQLIGSSEVPPEVQRRAAMDILSMPLGDAPQDEATRLRVLRIECDDGVIALPADMFVRDEFEPDWEEDTVVRRVYITRREYLRIISSRTEPGPTRVLSVMDDVETIRAIDREQGRCFPESEEDGS